VGYFLPFARINIREIVATHSCLEFEDQFMNWSKEEIEALTKIRNLHAALAEAYEELLKNPQQTETAVTPSPVATAAPTAPAAHPAPKPIATKPIEPVSKPAKTSDYDEIQWDFGGESAKGIWEKSTDYSSPQYQELFKMIGTATRQPLFYNGVVYWLLQDGKTIARRKK
jgi:hypothetical protein